MEVVKRLVRAIDWISAKTGLIVAFLLPLMVLVLFVEVFSRYVFRSPTSWAQEAAIYMFAAIGLVAGADAMRKKAHISVDLFYSMFPARVRACVDILVAAVVLFFLGLVIYFGSLAAMDAFSFGMKRPMRPQLPLGPFLALIPLGGLLLFLQTVANTLRSLVMLLTGKELEA
ncbi:TRAP transporter small permease subunit [Mameliella sediminis]|uniref:TRAP transporter small permease subunit n=1 Tax=Mameliella sediminis TaxID=2836866 RepID=UPI001C48228F|nr:TRAP transporter small permease subunit [Mameliella sediminis]MBY6113255.1 TRAP transporter small permease subunit [Antarctobacter heliothermus]MBY6143397.1 TRAP transporter small permease subunit [Mameliella alba]MBV7394535.1 TRAP transporter small permease subunit [Mameliella sediminis]MBY6164076.1 TRAP transporter small permease subunit [Mameliella alba]MBY6172580.1 TRAP transporter small permease subunit [Mameliella alba]